MSNALVILSGGQNSTTCLGVAFKTNTNVAAISFDCGHHSAELSAAKLICEAKHIPWTCVDLPFFNDLITSALLNHAMDVSAEHGYKPNLPASFVPNRNALFITLAHAYAQEIQADYIYTGVCQIDYSSYPDCQKIFIDRLNDALNIGYETSIQIIAPLMDLTKAETFRLAEDVGILDAVIEFSVTCYRGDVSKVNDWGYGCGECPACVLRSKGWEEYTRCFLWRGHS